MTPVYVVTGAGSCGKTTTLEYLHRQRGVRFHPEAHGTVLRGLGERTLGHPPAEPFAPIADAGHLCPMCRPEAFADLVLEHQRQLERRAAPGDFLDRGMLDPLELRSRRTGESLDMLAASPVARYVRVFLFAVMPELQEPRWGKSRAQRTEEAEAIEERLREAYVAGGYEVLTIPSGTVAERADRVGQFLERVESREEGRAGQETDANRLCSAPTRTGT